MVLWTRLGYTPAFEAAKGAIRRFLGRKLPPRGHSAQRSDLMRRGGVHTIWMSAAVADLLFTYGVVVPTIAAAGRPVICDRYIWDALIDRALFHPEAAWVDRMLTAGFRLLPRRPDAALLLWVPLAVSEERSIAKNEPFPDPPERRARRHRAYADLLERDELRVVDAGSKPEEVAAEIARIVGLE